MIANSKRLLQFVFAVLGYCPLACLAQQAGLEDLRQAVERPMADGRREQLYVHTDKDFYLAGELCWFRIYAMDAATHRPAGISKVGYIEILDAQGRPATQAKISLDSAGGSGSFYLPVSLNSGNYQLRAYTNWMKKAGSGTFFRKNITIVNTLKNSTGILARDTAAAFIDFFPEGGQLINDMEGRVAFRLRKADGTPASGLLTVTGSDGDTITSAATNGKGIGRFSLTPADGNMYRATAILGHGRSVNATLPAAQRNGYILIADGMSATETRIIVKSNVASQQGKPVYIIAHANGKVYAAAQHNIQLETLFNVPTADLPAGVTTFTLFDYRQQPVGERLIFKKPGAVSPLLTVGSDRPTYKSREKVSLALKYEGADTVDYSASVFLLDSFQHTPQTITGYFLLGSHLREEVNDAAWYFSDDPDAAEQADNLMLTAGWRTFAKQETSTVMEAIPEIQGHLITARVIKLPDEKPAADVVCYLSAGASPFEFLIARSDSNGYVHFNTRKYYGPGDIIVQTQSWQGGAFRVDLATPFVPASAGPVTPFFTLPEALRQQLEAKSIAMQAMNVYSTDSMSNFVLPVLSDTLPFYGKAEFSYTLDDYKRFTTMEEVLREYVTPVGVNLRNGKLSLNMFDAKTQTIYRKELVLALLDGIPLQDPDKVFAIDPMKIRRIEVVPSVYMYGPSIFTGILSLESYNGHAEGIELEKGLISVDYEGLQLRRRFYSPDYSAGNTALRRIPDLRNTLQWIPHATVTKGLPSALDFYTSDMKGKYLIMAEGITSNGVPVAATGTFTVE